MQKKVGKNVSFATQSCHAKQKMNLAYPKTEVFE